MYSRILKGFEKDQPEYVECPVKGDVPKWLSGSLLRNGTGKFTVGSDEYQHLFDGLAVIHQYKLENGKVLYKNKLLESETKDRCLAANRIVVSEFGTVAYPDPCKSIFTRYFSYFMHETSTDNACVNLLTMGDQLYAMTETPRVKRLNTKDLSTIGEVNTKDILSLHLNTAHPQQEADGTVYNLGSQFGGNTQYVIFKAPAAQDGDADPYNKVEVFAKIPANNPGKPSYFHSFAMTENYLLVIEQPLYIKLMSMIWIRLKWSNRGINDAFEWDGNGVTRFHIVDKKTREILPNKFEAPAMFFFHTVNAYEDGDTIICDISSSRDANIIQECLFTDNIRKGEMGEAGFIPSTPYSINRYILPLKGVDTCSAIEVESIEPGLELPRINEKYVGIKYRYSYGITIADRMEDSDLVKIDMVKKEHTYWKDERYACCEPVFVPSPDGTDEDDGVILAPILGLEEGVKTALLILNARDMTEIARAEIPEDVKVPFTFHGFYSSKM